MTKLQEIANLTTLELMIIQFGKIEKETIDKPFARKLDDELLNRYYFYDLQDKYTYGWYIAEETLEEQIKSIEKFKLYIMDNYMED